MYYSFFNADFNNCDINFPKLYFGEFAKNTLFPFSTKDVKEVVIKKNGAKTLSTFIKVYAPTSIIMNRTLFWNTTGSFSFLLFLSL